MKSTFLSWMAQLNIPLSARLLQGHHKTPEWAQLYSRDDIWPALRAQLLLWRSLHGGFRPLCLQHRGRQHPLVEPAVVLCALQWKPVASPLLCFTLCDDSGTFLRLQEADKDLVEALQAAEPPPGTSPHLPRCVAVNLLPYLCLFRSKPIRKSLPNGRGRPSTLLRRPQSLRLARRPKFHVVPRAFLSVHQG